MLFVCLGNACRSPMGEAIARRDAADVMEVSSAGLIALKFLPELTVETLERNGYSAEGLVSEQLTDERLDAAELVINMSGRPKEAAFDRTEIVEDWMVEDPYGENAAVYQRIFNDIQRRVKELAERLRATAVSKKSAR